METTRSPHSLAHLASICHHDAHELMEPANFCSSVTESAKRILEHHATNLCEIQSGFCSNKQCITSLDIASLLDLNSVYSFNVSEISVESREQSTDTSSNEDYDAECDVYQREVSDSKESINSSEIIADEGSANKNRKKHPHVDHMMMTWFHRTSDLLYKNGMIETLVKCLGCCRFTSYLAKKALVSAIKGGHVEVLQVLESVESLFNDHSKCMMAILELVRDLMSRRIFKDCGTVIDKTCVWFKHSQVLCFLNLALDFENKTFRTTEGLFEYLECIQKSLKHIMSQKNIEFHSDFVNTISNSIVSKFEPFFSLQRASGGHLICSKFVNIVDSILNIQYIISKEKIPQCILDVATRFKAIFLRAFELCHKNGLFSTASFIGSLKQLAVHDYRSSVLFRGIILCILKASALLCSSAENMNECVNILKSLWLKGQHLFNKTDHSSSTSDNSMILTLTEKSLLWLPEVFADQDDQWINALLCLLIIRQGIIKSSDSCTVDDECDNKAVALQQGLQHTCIPTLEEGSLKLSLPSEMHQNHTSKKHHGEAKAILPFSSSHLEHKPKEQFSNSLTLHSKCDLCVKSVDNKDHDECITSKREMDQYENGELLGSKELLIAFCPHRLFLQFSHFIHYDHLVISDFLTSPETKFLEYFSRYLHILLHEWESVKEILISEMSDPCVTPEGIGDQVVGCEKGNEIDIKSSGLLRESIPSDSVVSHSHVRKRRACSPWINSNNEESSAKRICQNTGESQVNIPLTNLVSYSDSDDSRTSNDETDQDNLSELQQGEKYDHTGTDDFIDSHTSNDETDQDNLSELQQGEKYDHTGTDDSIDSFHHAHDTQLDNLMGMLIRLRYHIQRLKDKKLFPYSVNPLLKLLLFCEDKYDTAD